MPEKLNQRRLEAIRLRLDGHTVAETSRRTGLSAPTISAAWKAFRQGGWEAVPIRSSGRPRGGATVLGKREADTLWQLLADQPPTPLPGWSSRELADTLPPRTGASPSPRAIEHWLEANELKPHPLPLKGLEKHRSQAGRWYRQQVYPIHARLLEAGGMLWIGGARALPAQQSASRGYRLHVHGKRDILYLRCLTAPPMASDYLALFERLQGNGHGPTGLVFHGAWFQTSLEIRDWLSAHPDFHLINVPPNSGLEAL